MRSQRTRRAGEPKLSVVAQDYRPTRPEHDVVSDLADATALAADELPSGSSARPAMLEFAAVLREQIGESDPAPPRSESDVLADYCAAMRQALSELAPGSWMTVPLTDVMVGFSRRIQG